MNGSVGAVLLIGGFALILGSGDSVLLVALGAHVAAAGVLGFATGFVLLAFPFQNHHASRSVPHQTMNPAPTQRPAY